MGPNYVFLASQLSRCRCSNSDTLKMSELLGENNRVVGEHTEHGEIKIHEQIEHWSDLLLSDCGWFFCLVLTVVTINCEPLGGHRIPVQSGYGLLAHGDTRPLIGHL